MINFSKYKVLLWDFDGVLMDSMPVRDMGFELTLKDHPKKEVDSLLEYHRLNGGLSRYVKFRYFFEEIKKQTITEKEILLLSEEFSQIMRQALLNKSLLIQDSLSFVKAHHQDKKMHIVSGSDQEELRYLCGELDLEQYFLSIHGSPTAKTLNIQEIIEKRHYPKHEVIMIGDSINDFEAAQDNGIAFSGYNNQNLKDLGVAYVENFSMNL